MICGMIAGCAIIGPKQNENPKQVAIVSGHPDRKPVTYRSGDALAGIGVEATREAFKQAGVDISPVYAWAWDVVQQKAKDGQIDAIVALYKTEGRETYLDYSIAYTDDPVVLFFSAGKAFPYTGKESLLGKTWVSIVGESHGQGIDEYIISAKVDMLKVSTPQEAFALVKEGRADYFIYSLYAGSRVLIQEWLSGFEKSRTVSSQPCYIGISKKSPYAKLMPLINAALQKMIEEGRIPNE